MSDSFRYIYIHTDIIIGNSHIANSVVMITYKMESDKYLTYMTSESGGHYNTSLIKQIKTQKTCGFYHKVV